MKVSDIARTAHEVNRAYCASLGDASQLPWDEAPGWQKDSAVNGVLFHLNHPDAAADASHNNWLDEKKAQGWVYGPVKDPAKKRASLHGRLHRIATRAADQGSPVRGGRQNAAGHRRQGDRRRRVASSEIIPGGRTL